MPPEDGELNVSEAVDAFLADDSNDSDDSDEHEEPAAAAAPAAETEADDDGEKPAEETPAAPAAAAEPSDQLTALGAAIEKGDPKAFLEALGDHADALLGGKAHKSLRLAAGELKKRENEITANAEKLLAKFGDPIAAAKAAEAGDVDTFVDALERQYGASWKDIVKFVNDKIAGRDVRLEAKAAAKSAETAAETATRTAAEASVRNLITEHVKGANAKLLESKDVSVVDDIFEAMRAGFKQGVNTPAKAWAVVQKRYKAIAALVAPAAPAPAAKPTPPARPAQIRPPATTPQSVGRKPQDMEEMVAQFLKEEGLSERA